MGQNLKIKDFIFYKYSCKVYIWLIFNKMAVRLLINQSMYNSINHQSFQKVDYRRAEYPKNITSK